MSENITEPPESKPPSGENFEVHAKLPQVGEVKLTLYQEAWSRVAQFWRRPELWIVGGVLFGSIFGMPSIFMPPQQPQPLIVPKTETAKPLPKQ
jgi:hypothetical protein